MNSLEIVSPVQILGLFSTQLWLNFKHPGRISPPPQFCSKFWAVFSPPSPNFSFSLHTSLLEDFGTFSTELFELLKDTFLLLFLTLGNIVIILWRCALNPALWLVVEKFREFLWGKKIDLFFLLLNTFVHGDDVFEFISLYKCTGETCSEGLQIWL